LPTVRDLFAIGALIGFGPNYYENDALLAEECYKRADALLAARGESK